MDVTMTKPTCPHRRTQLIAKDKDVQYVECLDCGEILESAEMEKAEKKEGAGFDESLSDA
jgi:Zn ribbon nucleic-acid-binding protein